MPFWDSWFKPNVEELNAKRDINGLIRALQYGREKEKARLEAIGSLVRYGAEREIQRIRSNIENAVDIRKSAAKALGQLDNLDAVLPLIDALDDDDNICMVAIEALGQLRDTRAVEPLIHQLDKGKLAMSVAEALAKIGDIRAVDPLVATLRNSDSYIRKAAAEALEGLNWISKPDEDGAYYWIALENWEQCIAIGALAVNPLIFAIVHHYQTREAAIAALGQIRDSAAVEPLVTALKHQHSDVRSAAAKALGQVGSSRAFELVSAVLNDSDKASVSGAVEALGQIGDSRAVEPLIAILRDSNSYLSNIAAKALGQIGDSRAVEPLIDALRHEDTDIRIVAAEALGKTNDTRAFKPLLRLLQDKYSYVKKAAIYALKNCPLNDELKASLENSVKGLLEPLNSVYSRVDKAVVGTLEAVVGTLELMLEHGADLLTTSDLHYIVGLNDPMIFIGYQDCVMGGMEVRNEITKRMDINHLRQLARQELIRRGEQT